MIAIRIDVLIIDTNGSQTEILNNSELTILIINEAGAYNISILAYDKAGNSGKDSIIISLLLKTNESSETDPTNGVDGNNDTNPNFPIELVIVSSIIIVGTGVSVIILHRKGHLNKRINKIREKIKETE